MYVYIYVCVCSPKSWWLKQQINPKTRAQRMRKDITSGIQGTERQTSHDRVLTCTGSQFCAGAINTSWLICPSSATKHLRGCVENSTTPPTSSCS